jgi:hypothetical protein
MGVLMVLTTTTVEDFERFLGIFSTKGLEKRRQHGSGGARVFRDPSDGSRVWVVFDWDEESYQRLLSDPDMPAIFQEAGLHGPPQKAELAGEYEA